MSFICVSMGVVMAVFVVVAESLLRASNVEPSLEPAVLPVSALPLRKGLWNGIVKLHWLIADNFLFDGAVTVRDDDEDPEVEVFVRSRDFEREECFGLILITGV